MDCHQRSDFPARLGVLLLVTVLAACTAPDPASTTAPTRAVASVPITSATTQLIPGGSVQLYGKCLDIDGQQVASAISWSTSSISVGFVSSSGLLTAVAPGTVIVTAICGGQVGTIVISVEPTPIQIQLDQTIATFTAFAGGLPLAPGTVHVTNSGGVPLTGLTIGAVEYHAGEPAGWLTPSLTATGTPTTLALSVQATALPIGTYHAIVRVASAAPGVTNSPQSISATLIVTQFVTITGWASQSCALTGAGAAYCWGATDNGDPIDFGTVGAVGDGTRTWRTIPTPLAGGLAFRELSVGGATGGNHACGLTTSGAPYCWGERPGTVTGGITQLDLAPTMVQLSPQFDRIEAGSLQSCALTTAGAAYCWGQNTYGAIGAGTTANHSVPYPVAGNRTFTQLSGRADYVCGLVAAGDVFCWGENHYGQLGDGTTIRRLVPTQVTGVPAFVQISAGEDHTCGLTNTGVAWCWGSNDWGQLGNGATTEWSGPAPVPGHTFVEIGAGLLQTCGRTAAGAIFCWGGNNGALGVGGGIQSTNVPLPVSGGMTFTAMHVAWEHTCGITAGSQLYCWGNNQFGQLGDGTTTQRFIPTLVRLP